MALMTEWLKSITKRSGDGYLLTRLLIIRSLGFIYSVVFLIIFNQAKMLWGPNGLLPIDRFIEGTTNYFGAKEAAFWNLPSLFYFFDPNSAMPVMGLLGIIGGCILMAGFANSIILFGLWWLQLSFVNSGQLFYGYGWETLLLEFTFLCIFMVPLWHLNLRTAHFKPPKLIIWAMRWLLFRLMFGAGLIKIRGDACWTQLSCLIYHYETQPNPHPLSYFFHKMPEFFHTLGILFNHFVELVVPFGIFGPRRLRLMAGLFIAAFQVVLITSGNLAWFNWLSLVVALSCFDDAFFNSIGFTSPRPLTTTASHYNSRGLRWVLGSVLFCGLTYWSIDPTINLFKSQQAMNTSYDQWHLVNSYGAFGTIGKERLAVVIAGSNDGNEWQDYQLPCATDSVSKRPCLITPYHYHLDWQMWFSAMRPQIQEEWLLRLAVRLLENNSLITESFALNPFKNTPPKFIKMDLYRYRYANWSDWPETWWQREFIKNYLPPISLEMPEIKNYLSRPE